MLRQIGPSTASRLLTKHRAQSQTRRSQHHGLGSGPRPFAKSELADVCVSEVFGELRFPPRFPPAHQGLNVLGFNPVRALRRRGFRPALLRFGRQHAHPNSPKRAGDGQSRRFSGRHGLSVVQVSCETARCIKPDWRPPTIAKTRPAG